MATFAENTWFYICHCASCAMPFAYPTDFDERRRNDHKTFYCPAGHSNYYSGPSEAQKLRKELERKEQMLDAAQARASKAETEREQITRAHKKMRVRVMNGVCPCCNRTFQNLMQHMQSEHPDFSSTRTMLTMRNAFGMTQAEVAREAGVDAAHVSLYEREKPVAGYAKDALDNWVERHRAIEKA
jgi:chromosome segregation ATPase